MAEITSVLPGRPWYKPLLSRWMQGTLDAAALAFALHTAYALRFAFVLSADRVREALIQLPLVLLVQVSLLRAFGTYSFVWRYLAMTETGAFVRAFGFLAVALLACALAYPTG